MTLEERLADAEAQYHDLVTGQQAKVFVDSNGERVEYSMANRADLAKYIQSLKDQITDAAGRARVRGPMRVYS